LDRDYIIYIILIIVILLCLIAILMLSIKLVKLKGSKGAAVGLGDLLVRQHRSEPDSFRYKLSPHLLKNALNAIQSHAYQSYYALDKLSSVLDYILYEAEGEFVSLKEELNFALDLIEINRLKTSPLFDLQVRNKIDMTDLRNAKALIAPFITINPIENAFKHADLQNENSFIAVVFEIKDDWFLLSVSNKFVPKNPASSLKGGLGNKAFEDRLNTIYGENFQLEETQEGQVYSTRLKLRLDARA